jgi:hypothetical protein
MSEEMEKRAWQAGRCEVRALEDGRRRIVQRAVPYGELSVDLGGWREVIVAGAFATDGEDIHALWQHRSDQVLGRTTTGTLRLQQDDTGIYSEIDPPDTQWARDALVSIERGDVDRSSFAFYTDEDEWLLTANEVIRRVKRGRLAEVSPVTFPAYPSTSTALRDKAAAMRAQAAAGAGEPPADGREAAETQARARAAARRRRLEMEDAR